MKKNVVITILGLVFGFLLIFGRAQAATAPETTGIQISPVTFNFEIKPGATEVSKVTVTNRNNESMDYVLETELFNESSEDGVPSFEAVKAVKGISSLSDWIKFADGTSGTIAAKGSKEINFTIEVPKDADPGGHYGAIFVKQIKTSESGQNEVTVAARVGALVLVSVPGQTTKTAQITEFKSPKFVWRGPANFTMKVQNNGTVHYDSGAKVDLKSLFGATSTVDLGTHTIIPKSIRAYTGDWAKKYPFGYYKVTGSATDGDKNPVTKSTYLIAIPLIIVIPIIIFLILLIILIKYLRRHMRFVDTEKNDQKKSSAVENNKNISN